MFLQRMETSYKLIALHVSMNSFKFQAFVVNSVQRLGEIGFYAIYEQLNDVLFYRSMAKNHCHCPSIFID